MNLRKIKYNKNPIEIDKSGLNLFRYKTICLTGKMGYITKTEFKKTLKNKVPTIKFSDTITKKTDYLIIGNNPGSFKLRKAKEYNIKEVSLDWINQFL